MNASDNETVAEIVKEMRRDAIAADAWCETHGEMASAASVLNRHADRIEEAHRREIAELKNDLELTRQQRNRARLDAQEKFGSEIAELRECLKEAMERLCQPCPYRHGKEKCADCDDVQKWRKSLEGANHA